MRSAILAAVAVTPIFASMTAAAPPNLSSHPAPLFEKLFAGRVFVHQWVTQRDSHLRATPKATYFGPDGVAHGCYGSSYDKDWANDGFLYRYVEREHNWQIRHRNHAFISLRRDSSKAATRRIFYDPGTGRLHMEGRTKVGAVGWIQDSWPRALADACPNLPLPEHLVINEKQTSTSIEELRAQDPEAPIRNFPGSEHRVPGAVGQAITGGEPTITREELADFMRAQNGMELLNTRGKRRVLVLDKTARDQVWKVDAEGAVTNVGYFDVAPDGSTIGIAWEKGKPVKARYTVGYAFPYAPTGERFAAFRLGDWLADQPSVTLPFFGRAAAFRFSPDGTLATNKKDGSVITGSWRWSRGSLEIRFPGLRDVATYEWRALARQVGWSPTASASSASAR